jgi:hypothetical protein
MDHVSRWSHAVWLPSKRQPGRIHVAGRSGRALCGAGIETQAVRCALCTLGLYDHPHIATKTRDVRAIIEAECADDPTDPPPDHLLPLADPSLDTTAEAAAEALEPASRLLCDTYVEMEQSIQALAMATDSARATVARSHLVEALVALDVTFGAYHDAEAALRLGWLDATGGPS